MYRVYTDIDRMMVRVGRIYKNLNSATRYLSGHFAKHRGYITTDQTGHEMPVHTQNMPAVETEVSVMAALRALA